MGGETPRLPREIDLVAGAITRRGKKGFFVFGASKRGGTP